MKLRVLICIIIIVLLSSGCSKNQKAVPLDNVETRIHITFDKQSEENKVEDINEFNEDELKQLYLEYADYEITEDDLKKVLIRTEDNYTIIHFNPVVSGIELNNSYVIQLHDGYISAISTNPSKYKIPEEFEVENIIEVKKRDKLKEKIKKKYAKKGKIDKITDQLYFDCHEYGKLIYSINLSVDSPDYSFAKVYIYDAYSGNLLNES